MKQLYLYALTALAQVESSEIQICTSNQWTLSEYYTQLFIDTVHNNNNEKFTYNETSHTLQVKSNGQCVDVGSNPPPAAGYNTAVTSPKRCLSADHKVKGSFVKVEPCNNGNPMLSNQFFADCTTTRYIPIVSPTTGKRISGIYFDQPADNFNELFIVDYKAQMYKSASSQQCLGSYLDSDGKYKLHTYPCDINNPNQKWVLNEDHRFNQFEIEHATHKGQCLDGDPTYPDHHMQMLKCTPKNSNQQWKVEVYAG
ncbi:hypothetical protein THRCLA_05727 [Thraustotheca clavata]|uniref:Ricin B lectin domain-containing protein n=1 Tax=Thraustotheca clavata TaxID=74557 RepID=A0A1V9ZUY8_9STRA|nr:hypothetical protein THRCLA_05727 [Thraustotheca clavata]